MKAPDPLNASERAAEERLDAFQTSVVRFGSIVDAVRAELEHTGDTAFAVEALTDDRMRLHYTTSTREALQLAYPNRPAHLEYARHLLEEQWESLWKHTEAGRGAAALSYRDRVLAGGMRTEAAWRVRPHDDLDDYPQDDPQLVALLRSDLRRQAGLVLERRGILMALTELDDHTPFHSREVAHALSLSANLCRWDATVALRDGRTLRETIGLGYRPGLGDPVPPHPVVGAPRRDVRRP